MVDGCCKSVKTSLLLLVGHCKKMHFKKPINVHWVYGQYFCTNYIYNGYMFSME